MTALMAPICPRITSIVSIRTSCGRWAVGGRAFLLPKDVGFPIGDSGSDTFLLLNIHYDNPEQIAGVVDSSGLEFYYTESYRKYEAFTMGVGAAFDNRMFVPPKQSQFHLSGHCHTKCFKDVGQKFRSFNTDIL